MSSSKHESPALHNAMWPGIVGRGPDSEPFIDLDTMLGLTAAAEVDGTKFDGTDLFLSLPHTDDRPGWQWHRGPDVPRWIGHRLRN
jgi:hypothetical protein